MTTTAIAFLILWNVIGYAQNDTPQPSPMQQTAANEQQKSNEDSPARKAAIAVVAKIQRADYEGDRTALNKHYEELVPFVDNTEFASRIRYWRGFAKWRRAINGFNETPTPTDLAEDLTEGESEFDAAIQRDPGFTDAKVGAASCILLRAFLGGAFSNANDPSRIREALMPASKLLSEAHVAAPENPRLLWVIGPNEWNTPPDSSGQAKAMETYRRGLKAARAQKSATSDILEPSWGEPELLMNLAWANLHLATPDLAAAEQNAQAALELVPYWHYVRDILLPQIQDAKKKAS